mmetsp:Transcript_104444/g.204860  ORF Transcript_104444/g.204860 Transcript_104444/m.204860 type:complete len:220 (+) Transcript_104444:50-709(+)
MDQINTDIVGGDVSKALDRLSQLELQIEEASITQNAIATDPHFYAIFMSCYLIKNELSNAKYLWKRSPDEIKATASGSMLAEMWEVGKAIWKEDISRAIELINVTPWTSDLQCPIDMLKNRLINSHLSAVGLTYEHIQLSSLVQTFHMTAQQVEELLRSEAWAYDAATGIVTPSPAATQCKVDNIAAGVNQSLLLLQRATEVAAHMEQQPIKSETTVRN